MNTIEQIDELFRAILEKRQMINLKNFEIDCLMKIRKVKLQFYFKEKFAQLRPQLQKLDVLAKKQNPIKNPISKSSKKTKYLFKPLSKGMLENMSVVKIADYLGVGTLQLTELLLKNNITISNHNDRLSSKEIDHLYDILNRWYNSSLQKEGKNVNTENDEIYLIQKQYLSIDAIANHSIADIAQFVNQPTRRIIYVLNSNNIHEIDENTILSLSDIKIIYSYLNNAFNVYLRKKSKDKEEQDYNGITKKNIERFKPSWGQEGDYRKLIYIRTKT